MSEYLNIGEKEQSNLIKTIKNNCDLSWEKIARELGVVRSMVFFYRSGKCRIPRDKLKKLVNLGNYPIDIETLPFVKANYSLLYPSIPKMNEKLSEFVGILCGDGCLGRDNYLIAVSGDSIADLSYHKNHVAPLMNELFCLAPRFKFEKYIQEMHTIITSKILHTYLAETFLFPIGEKKNRMHIPKQIYEKEEYKFAFLRGLFDTDGGVHRHHNSSIQIQYTSSDYEFNSEVKSMLESCKFYVGLNDWDLQIRGKEAIHRFFREVSPANPKHQYKYQQFAKTGVVPLHRDIDYSAISSVAVPNNN